MPFYSEEQIQKMIAEATEKYRAENEELRKENAELRQSNIEALNKLAITAQRQEEINEQIRKGEEKLLETSKELEETKKLAKTAIAKGEKQQKLLDAQSRAISAVHSSDTIEQLIEYVETEACAEMEAAECTVYCVDPTDKNAFFTIDRNGERQKIEFSEDSLIAQAINSQTAVIANDLQGVSLGDGNLNEDVQNTMIIPLKGKVYESRVEGGRVIQDEKAKETVLAVAVAKNKEGGFKENDEKAFNSNVKALYGQGFETRISDEKYKAADILSKTSAVTHFPSVRAYEEFVATKVFDRAAKGLPVTEICIDIDKFKRYNDNYSHATGDRCLRHTLHVFEENLRADEYSGIFNSHGDEISIILPYDEETAWVIAERLRKALEETPFIAYPEKEDTKNETIGVTASFGVASYKPQDPDILTRENILEEFKRECSDVADQYLSEGKNSGRNKVFGSSEIMQKHQSEVSPTSAFKDFFDEMGFTLTKDSDGFGVAIGEYSADGRDFTVGEPAVKGLRNTKELMHYLVKENWIKANVTDCLQFDLDNYCQVNGLTDYDEFMELDRRGFTSLKEWHEVLEEMKEKPQYEEFLTQCSENVSKIDLFANKMNEVKLDNIALKNAEWLGIRRDEKEKPVPDKAQNVPAEEEEEEKINKNTKTVIER